VALGAEATAEDFEDALDDAIDDPEVDSVVAVYIPPLNVSGEAVANVLAAVGEQSDKPLLCTFLGAEGIPELLRVPDVAGSTAGRGSVPSYPAVEMAVRALARVVDYTTWLRAPEQGDAAALESDAAGARRIVNELLMRSPDGRDLDDAELRSLLACYGIDLWATHSVATAEEAVAAGEALGWNVVLKGTAEHLRHRPDLAHVWRSIDEPEEMTGAWSTLTDLLGDPARAGFVVQRNSPPGVPVAIGTLEDPLFGPVVTFGISGPFTELLEDRSYRIPPLEERDASEMVRELKAAPLLFGYRGADRVDVDAIERLIRLVAQLKADLPQVRSLDLSLVLAGAEAVSVLTANARVEPVADPRSDWFVRRLSSMPGDTIPG